MKCSYDIVIIGAGAVGCACARALSQYKLSVAVLEKESDVACGTSGRNSAVVHAGFNNEPGSLMAKLCVEGNKGFEALCRELDVPYKKTGKLLIAFDKEDAAILERLLKNGLKNQAAGLKMLDEETLHQREPYVKGLCAMESANTAIFNPFLYTVALAENAKENGADFFFDSELTGTSRIAEGFCLEINHNLCINTKIVINCAGLYSAQVSALFGVNGYHIYPCRGEYFILDKEAAAYLTAPVYPAPKPGIGGLGVHLTPTIDGNIIIGPSAEYIDDPEDYATTGAVMEQLFQEAKQLLPKLEKKHIIGSYAGIRAKQAPPKEGGFHDFVIKEEETCPGLINLIGIESPGLTASVPIANMVRDIIGTHINLYAKENYNPCHHSMVRFRELPLEKQEELVCQSPDYGEIVCRCELVTKHEIREAIENPLGVRSITAIKNRTRATTGRCQGGYCLAKIAEILIQEYAYKPEEIRLRGAGSELFEGAVK